MTSPPPEPRWLRIPVERPPEGGTRPFELEGIPLLLCHVRGAAHVVHNVCSHVQTPLTEGALRGHLLECPLHGGRVDVRDGSPAGLPIRRPVRVYATREAGDGLEVALP